MKLYIADFETTVEADTTKQKQTEVWAFGIAELFDKSNKIIVGNSIQGFWKYLQGLKSSHIVCYFHNLKFDGTFIISDIVTRLGFKQAFIKDKEKSSNFITYGEQKKSKELNPGEYITVITDTGIWYSITVQFQNIQIEFRDSLKLLPMKVEEMHKAFNTKHKKLEMDYKAHKGAREVIDEFEKAYIVNDILVPKEALEIFLETMNYQDYPPLTISQAALKEFKKFYKQEDFDLWFPNLAEIELDREQYGSSNIDEYCRKAYYGGWCYVDERRTGIPNGYTVVYDVNSLYPSVLHSKSGNYYPVGVPKMTKNKHDIRTIPKTGFYIIRFKCKFELSKGYLPFIQLRHDPNFRSNENLKYSYNNRYNNIDTSRKVELTLTRPIFEAFVVAYNIKEFEFLDMAIFNTELGMFDSYINKFMEMKINAVKNKNKALKTIAKLFLNGLYGKFGTDPENKFVITKQDMKGEVIYTVVYGQNKKPVYVPVAAACTGYARRFTVCAAINNYEYYLYTDTDSVHLHFPATWTKEQVENFVPNEIKLDDSALLCWKRESIHTNSIYLRQKTYMDYSPKAKYKDADGNEQIGLYDIKACGLPDHGKLLFEAVLKGIKPVNNNLYIPHEDKIEHITLSKKDLDFLSQKLTIKHFKQGLSIPGKLSPRKIEGGCVLVESNFTII